MQFTEDTILGGKVRLRQPIDGYRVAIDPIFLAACVEVASGEKVLDVGAGTGAAALCLAARNPLCKITGLELQWDYLRLAIENIEMNNCRNRVEMIYGDLATPPPRLAAGTFSHVMTNPPYLEREDSRLPQDAGKAQAQVEVRVNLAQWIRFCLLMLKPKGTLTIIHRTERLGELVACVSGKVGDIIIFPLWSGKKNLAKRFIFQATKNSQGPLRLASGLVLHQEDGKFTKEADAILREGQRLELLP